LPNEFPLSRVIKGIGLNGNSWVFSGANLQPAKEFYSASISLSGGESAQLVQKRSCHSIKTVVNTGGNK
jgi:hypothetical protein